MSKIRRSAMGKECQVRIPGICSFNPETTVLAHLNGGGIARKNHDFLGAYCCYDCHQAIDGHRRTQYTNEQIDMYFYQGIFRTQQILFNEGLIATKWSK